MTRTKYDLLSLIKTAELKLKTKKNKDFFIKVINKAKFRLDYYYKEPTNSSHPKWDLAKKDISIETMKRFLLK